MKKFHKLFLILLLPIIFTLLLFITKIPTYASGTTLTASTASDGTPANDYSNYSAISADGRYVAFDSDGTNLVAGDTNGFGDVFVKDLITNNIERVSIASDGTQGNNSVQFYPPAISADGRYVAFTSHATNLVPNDTNNSLDVFVRDRVAHTTERVSVDSNGIQLADGRLPSISPDGRYVAFLSNTRPPGDFPLYDIYVRDRVAQTTEHIVAGVSDAGERAPQISADGRYVAFWSDYDGLVPNDTNGKSDIFITDRQTHTTERVSVDSNGVQGNDNSVFAAISGDGRYVAFQSAASNLVSNDTNGRNDIFLRDRQTNTTELVSLSTNGEQANNASQFATVSDDGRYLAFQSAASNLVSNDTNDNWDIFVRDRQANTTELDSLDQNNNQFSVAEYPVISSNGNFVAFADGTVYVRDRFGTLPHDTLPTVGAITVSTNPVQVNTSTTASASFTDPDVSDTHTAVWDWGDGSTTSSCPPNSSQCTLTESNGSGTVTSTHTYTAAGVYTITLTVTDNYGGARTQTFQYVSVYNPTAQGLFSAGQKYTSPAGAYAQNTSLTGTVLFGLSYKYQGSVPVGNRQFSMDFNAANFHFNATTVNSLVIANGIGTLTGTGTLNSSGTYNFLVTGSESANTIRIQITDPSNNNNVIYDTQPEAADTATPTTSVTGNVLAH